ncbi:hypothetical protein [Xenorhabdus japonica]|uniref:Uncharacterized protein n=1 Tax=Xenorhabdus japonica TaxID=53341 RepID=A0A1I5A746_9GAMM|nr:hypothetical protein [Xenorhabdus japonica]SFN58302.1 hypothetical protein SAMN05421579_11050 [Xenorhabdus japonica]
MIMMDAKAPLTVDVIVKVAQGKISIIKYYCGKTQRAIILLRCDDIFFQGGESVTLID